MVRCLRHSESQASGSHYPHDPEFFSFSNKAVSPEKELSFSYPNTAQSFLLQVGCSRSALWIYHYPLYRISSFHTALAPRIPLTSPGAQRRHTCTRWHPASEPFAGCFMCGDPLTELRTPKGQRTSVDRCGKEQAPGFAKDCTTLGTKQSLGGLRPVTQPCTSVRIKVDQVIQISEDRSILTGS